MASFVFRPAKREGVSLIIGLAGASGSGKSWSAMTLAEGLSGGEPFAVVDTEAGRAKHYADRFRFDHGDLGPPFTPARYVEAIVAADEAKYPVIVVDSASHAHAGEGGVLDMQEAEFKRMGGRDAVKMASWVMPKGEVRKMVSRLLQVRAHVILCFRAEEKVEMVRGSDGKMEVRKKQTATGLDGWVPICDRNLPYELTASFLLMASAPGVPVPIKLQEQHRPYFPLNRPITKVSGERLREWAMGKPMTPPPTEQQFVLDTPGVQGPVNPPAIKPNGPPPVGNLVLLSRIGAGFLKLGFSAEKQQERWREYCGEAAFMTEEASVADQQRLLENLRTQYAKAAE